jgi:Tfp pilus assembly protein PilN
MFAGAPVRKEMRAPKRRSDMYIGLGTVLLIILIVLLVVYVF